jgi:mannan endo-1,4-beta-mannosidase
VNWAREMSDYLRGLDPSHLIAVGDEGFLARNRPSDWPYNAAEGVDHEALTRLPNVDFGTVHLYPDHWNRTVDWGTAYIREHAQAAVALGKPAVLEEFGLQDKALRATAYRDWTAAALAPGFGGWQFWMLAGMRQDGTLYPDFDGFTVYGSSATDDVLRAAAQQMNSRP